MSKSCLERSHESQPCFAFHITQINKDYSYFHFIFFTWFLSFGKLMSESLSSFRWNIISPNNQYFDWIMNIIQKKLFIWKHIRYLVILIHSGRDALIWLIRDQDFAFRGTLSYPTLTSIRWEVQESNEPPYPLTPPPPSPPRLYRPFDFGSPRKTLCLILLLFSCSFFSFA